VTLLQERYAAKSALPLLLVCRGRKLKLAWRHDYRNDPANVPKKQLGKGFWATKGRYLNRAFLLALAEEIGHDTRLSDNIRMEPGVGDEN
jgi:hypothetical protein